MFEIDPCRQFKTIMVDSAGDVSWSEEHLAALTAWDRPNWAATRQKYFSSGPNKESLDTIEKVHKLLWFVLLGFLQLQDAIEIGGCFHGSIM